MVNLLGDWQDFCEGRKDFDKSHFYTLFAIDPKVSSVDKLRTIFSYFPKTDELVERSSNILAGGFTQEGLTFPHKDDSVTNEHLIELALMDLQQKKKVCQKLNDTELANIIDTAKPVFVSDIQQVKDALNADAPNMWLHELVHDHLAECWISKDKKTYALFEAYYGQTTDESLVCYAGAPLISENIDLSYYFKLWCLGGMYALTQDKVLVARRT